MSSDLATLAQLITENVQKIESVYSENGTPFPNLDDPTATGILEDSEVAQSTSLIIAAASRLIASLRRPHVAVQEACGAMYTSATLAVAVEANIAEVLREAGPNGLHARDIASKVGMDEVKLARCLRYLCAREHIFREISPNIFANNRLSAVLDTGKPFDAVKDRGPHRYDGAVGAAPGVGHAVDEALAGTASFAKFVLDPETAFTNDPKQSPLQKSFGFEGTFWQWIERPENEKRLFRFGAAMRNSKTLYPEDVVLKGYDWASLPEGSVVADVGGGVGAHTLTLARKFPHLRYIIQDRAAVVSDGERFWKDAYPQALESGLVKFQEHNFFDPQPLKDASIFVLRIVLHDWSDAEVKTILKHLRASATPNTKLVLLEKIVPYACSSEHRFAHIPGADQGDSLPPVLHGNMGAAEGLVYTIDMQMLNLLNGLERTVEQWIEATQGTGWSLSYINRGSMSSLVFDYA